MKTQGIEATDNSFFYNVIGIYFLTVTQERRGANGRVPPPVKINFERGESTTASIFGYVFIIKNVLLLNFTPIKNLSTRKKSLFFNIQFFALKRKYCYARFKLRLNKMINIFQLRKIIKLLDLNVNVEEC